MMNFGPVKILFTAVAALLILGPRRLPSALRSVAKAMSAIRKAGSQVSEELKSTMDPEPGVPQPRAGADPLHVPPPAEELRPGPRS